jgi:hypothetical protein
LRLKKEVPMLPKTLVEELSSSRVLAGDADVAATRRRLLLAALAAGFPLSLERNREGRQA